jgi:hypothetical protein
MTAPDVQHGSRYDSSESGWVGWIVFAATFIIVIGGMNGIQGLAALLRDEVYWVTLGGAVVTFDVTTWGWINLIFGILLVVVGVLLLQGSTFARVVAIVLVALNLISQFSWMTLYPFWSLSVIALDCIVLYALILHGGELKAP